MWFCSVIRVKRKACGQVEDGQQNVKTKNTACCLTI